MIGTMERREFLRTSAAAALLAAGSHRLSQAESGHDAPVYSTANPRWQNAYDFIEEQRAAFGGKEAAA